MAGMDAAERGQLGRLGGALLAIGSMAAVPAGLVLEPPPDLAKHLTSFAGVVIGLAFYFAPWERLADRWLYAIPLLGTAEVLVGVGLFSDDFAFFQVLIATFTAYAVKARADFIGFMAFFTATVFLPFAYLDEGSKEIAHHVLVVLPVLLISAGAVRMLKEAMEVREKQYRRFALEAVGLAERIRGGGPADEPVDPAEFERRLSELEADTERGRDLRQSG